MISSTVGETPYWLSRNGCHRGTQPRMPSAASSSRRLAPTASSPERKPDLRSHADTSACGPGTPAKTVTTTAAFDVASSSPAPNTASSRCGDITRTRCHSSDTPEAVARVTHLHSTVRAFGKRTVWTRGAPRSVPFRSISMPSYGERRRTPASTGARHGDIAIASGLPSIGGDTSRSDSDAAAFDGPPPSHATDWSKCRGSNCARRLQGLDMPGETLAPPAGTTAAMGCSIQRSGARDERHDHGAWRNTA